MRFGDFLEDSGRPIAYYPRLAHVLGSVKAAVFLSQLIYWSDKGKDRGWIYKSREEMEIETGLARREQECARKICTHYKVTEEKYVREEHRMYYRVNLEALSDLWESKIDTIQKQTKYQKRHMDVQNGQKSQVQNVPRLGTKRTQARYETAIRISNTENTSENTTKRKDKLRSKTEPKTEQKNKPPTPSLVAMTKAYIQANASNAIKVETGRIIRNLPDEQEAARRQPTPPVRTEEEQATIAELKRRIRLISQEENQEKALWINKLVHAAHAHEKSDPALLLNALNLVPATVKTAEDMRAAFNTVGLNPETPAPWQTGEQVGRIVERVIEGIH